MSADFNSSDGDGTNEIAAGAILDPSGGTQKGAVNIMFMNDDGSGSVDSTVEINDLTTNGPTLNNGDRFGYSIANIGDLDGDGVDDLAVGAAYDDGDGGTNRGAVHIMFMGASGSVKSTVEINDSTVNGPTLGDGDYFGRSIENIGDLDGDGKPDVGGKKGTSGADLLEGSDMDEKLEGAVGDDILSGGGGADFLVGGVGADTLVGGNGDATDTASFVGSMSNYSINTSSGKYIAVKSDGSYEKNAAGEIKVLTDVANDSATAICTATNLSGAGVLTLNGTAVPSGGS